METQQAIFFDRDGTLIEEIGHLHRVEDIRIYPEAFAAVRRVNQSGTLAIVITNQSAIARGLLKEKELGDLHRFLQEAFHREQARIDAFYYCPHHPEVGRGIYHRECTCRKPQPGMLLRAAQEFQLRLAACYMIGDKLIDVEAGHRAGCQAVLIKTGYGEGELQFLEEGKASAPFPEDPLRRPDQVAGNVLEAINWIMERTIERQPGTTH
jgi:D-glycero-D-manno-heptose 1,7-bisphosphate phosphatase